MPIINPSTNIFKSNRGTQELNFRNKSDDRTSLGSIEFCNVDVHGTKSGLTAVFNPKEGCEVDMAIAILGIGNVTEVIEREANDRADMIADSNYGHTEEGVLKQALISLRAIQIARERKQAEEDSLLKEAYGLYLLAYPKTTTIFEEFKNLSLSKFWVSNLKKIRRDPTVLGAL